MTYKENPLFNPHQYIGCIAVMKDGRHCKIIGDEGLPSSPTHKIIMQDLENLCSILDLDNIKTLNVIILLEVHRQNEKWKKKRF